jgi:hypothetical protein
VRGPPLPSDSASSGPRLFTLDPPFRSLAIDRRAVVLIALDGTTWVCAWTNHAYNPVLNFRVHDRRSVEGPSGAILLELKRADSHPPEGSKHGWLSQPPKPPVSVAIPPEALLALLQVREELVNMGLDHPLMVLEPPASSDGVTYEVWSRSIS